MSLSIPSIGPPVRPDRPVAAPPAAPVAAPVHAADAVDVLPAAPPREVLEAVDAAAARAARLARDNRELHFRKDEESGRIVIEVRDLDGTVIRTIPPSRALDVMTGLAEP